MSDLTIPPEFMCPISKDIMHDPVVINHNDESYIFDRNCIDTWKLTPGGDKNPLTMVDGFRNAPLHSASELKTKIIDFQTKNSLTIHETDMPELLPFSDYEQIQEDERVARELNIQLNGPPPRISQRHNISLMDDRGDVHQFILNFENIINDIQNIYPRAFVADNIPIINNTIENIPINDEIPELIEDDDTDDEMPDLIDYDGRIVPDIPNSNMSEASQIRYQSINRNDEILELCRRIISEGLPPYQYTRNMNNIVSQNTQVIEEVD